MHRFLLITTENNSLLLNEAVQAIKDEYGKLFELKKIFFNNYHNPAISLNSLKEEIDKATIILLDIRGDIRLARELPAILEGETKTIVVLVGAKWNLMALCQMGKFQGKTLFKAPKEDKEFNLESFLKTRRFAKLSKKLGKFLPFGMLKDMRNWVLAQEYYLEGGPENIKNLLLFLLKHYGDEHTIKDVPSPIIQPNFGLYLPSDTFLEDLEEYKKRIAFDEHKPTVGLFFYGGISFYDTKVIIDALWEHLKDDYNLINVFSKVVFNLDAISKYFHNNDLDLLVNLQYFRLYGGPYGGDPKPTYEILSELNIPVLTALRTFETDLTTWAEDKQGISPIEIILGVTLPELDGAIEPVFVGGLKKVGKATLGDLKDTVVIPDRIKRLGKRIKNWIALRTKANDEKKLAIILYDYPPGEANLGSAGYLDTFQSLELFLSKLQKAGYNLELPEEPIKELFLSKGIVNSPVYNQKAALRIPVKDYIEKFKELPREVQKEVIEKWGVPPGELLVENKEIILPGVILNNVFLGVQPSRGVHEDLSHSYHDKELPPHHQYLAYYFYLQDIFEADAVVHFGMHGTLEFTKGKEIALSSNCYPDILIGNLPNIYYYWIGNTSEATIAKRRSYALCISHASPPMKSSGLYEDYLVLEDLLNEYWENEEEKVRESIMELASKLHLEPNLELIEEELYRLKRSLIPHGLHYLDRTLTTGETMDYLLSVLRISREYPSILQLIADSKQQDWNELKNTHHSEEIETGARELIRKILQNESLPQWLDQAYREYVLNFKARLDNNFESENLLRALNGEYILPAAGGDPIRTPKVYPPGRAMFAFDPRLVPTVVASVRGGKAAELLIDRYQKSHSSYPDSVGVILWGFETMKTGGETIAMILNLLGVRIIHTKNPWFKELEVIPLEELKRPRIDVVITICGIFRDTFREHITLLNRAIRLVANLDEPIEQNYVKKHSREISKTDKDFALARIFGPSPTEYATSLPTIIENSSWEDETALVESYDESMSYAYLNGQVSPKEQVFSKLLTDVDLITQERDNHEYEVTDLDHYYEFLGGLSRSVQEKKGEQSEVIVVDSTEDEIFLEELQETITRATRTRLLNPRWIEGMLQHDHLGSKKVKDRVEYLLGFQATTRKVDNWVFDEVAERLIFDEEMHRRLLENNPYATLKISEIMLETHQRGYWDIDEETLKKLRDKIINIEMDIE
ncbi:MAG: magnesium chelatase subunit H [Candidatus Heimdallarchaeota archaeon]|nr:magnesium chelatase subunit H [Candidatus Heimdallarchaeota archaeon]